MPAEKLYCYVDETGQDTHGRLFIVSVVVAKKDRDELQKILETIEHETGKGLRKWRKARTEAKIAYLERIFTNKLFARKIFYRLTPETTAYREATLQTIAAVVQAAKSQER